MEQPILSPNVDWAAIRTQFAQRGRTLIRDCLSPDDTARAVSLATGPLPWTLQYREGGSTKQLSEASLLEFTESEKESFATRLNATAEQDFQFSYFSCSLAPSDVSQFTADHDIHWLVGRMVNELFVDRIRDVVGDPAIRGLTASLTRYDRGQYLLPHDDTDSRDDRRAAYVLNLSEDWWPDYGGLLQFLDESRNVTECFTPHLGSLALFKVPQLHAVSLVAAHAPRSRFAVTGWLVA